MAKGKFAADSSYIDYDTEEWGDVEQILSFHDLKDKSIHGKFKKLRQIQIYVTILDSHSGKGIELSGGTYKVNEYNKFVGDGMDGIRLKVTYDDNVDLVIKALEACFVSPNDDGSDIESGAVIGEHIVIWIGDRRD